MEGGHAAAGLTDPLWTLLPALTFELTFSDADLADLADLKHGPGSNGAISRGVSIAG